jgi:hypothetical protein
MEENIPKTDSVLLCVNSDGSDKQVLIVIGKSSKPRCFKDGKKLPIKYHANSKAWMMTEIFCSFLHSLDTQMGAPKKVKAFFYAHSVTDTDRENILSLEKSYFQLRQNSTKKQKTMYDFFLLKKVVFRINRFPIFIICFLHLLEKR